MKLSVISIIPIELYTSKRRQVCEKYLLDKCVINPTTDKVKDIFVEMNGESSSIYNLPLKDSLSALIVFHESSMCLCIQQEAKEWSLNHSAIVRELDQRNKYHAAIIRNSANSPIYDFLKEFEKSISKSQYGEHSPSYVFSFHVLQKNDDDVINKQELIKLVEPSSIDMDDMISTECDTTSTNAYLKKSVIDDIDDVDLSNTSETYISWATIVSVTNQDSYNKIKGLLISLELRLQIVWNRCYSVSRFIDNVFDNKINTRDISELYWSFSLTLDDAKAVLSSTFSSRADKIFNEMIRTSKITGEIERLEQKLTLLEKFIEQRNVTQSKKYQKTIELLLFITAIASIAQIFFPIPISFFSKNIEIGIISLVAIVGVFAIFKSR